MSDIITLTGFVASDLRSLTTSEGLAITSFRLASNQRRFDKSQDKWVEAETNWYNVSTFRQLAANTAVSIKKGERVIVTGRVRVRDWSAGDKKGTSVDIEADALGHDLSWGTAAFSRGGGSAATESSAGSGTSTNVIEFPSAAELEAIVEGSPAPVAQAAGADVETPF
jgi:single-strand DNA-binding protein